MTTRARGRPRNRPVTKVEESVAGIVKDEVSGETIIKPVTWRPQPTPDDPSLYPSKRVRAAITGQSPAAVVEEQVAQLMRERQAAHTPPDILRRQEEARARRVAEKKRRAACRRCGAHEIEEDKREGCTVCAACGLVANDQLILDEPEYNLHADDPETGKQEHYGEAYDPQSMHSLTTRSRFDTSDPTIALENGIKIIRETLQILLPCDAPCGTIPDVFACACDLFELDLMFQTLQKKTALGHENSRPRLRKRFSKRKVIIVTAIWMALEQQKLVTLDVDDGIDAPTFDDGGLTKGRGMTLARISNVVDPDHPVSEASLHSAFIHLQNLALRRIRLKEDDPDPAPSH